MKERLLQLLDLEQITPSKFADIIGVQRSSVSHVISGRNKPSYDFLHKTLKAFPGLNASWLMLGEGTMYEQMGRQVPGNLFDAPARLTEDPDPLEIPEAEPEKEQIIHPQEASKGVLTEAEPAEPPADTELETPPEGAAKIPAQKSKELKKVVQVMVIYEDDTFRTFTPAQ